MEENRLFEHAEEGFSLCLRVREHLPDLLEGFLDAAMAEVIRAHLSVCYLCMKECHEMELTIQLVETLPFVEMEKDFTSTIMAALEAQSEHSFQAPVVEMETEAIVRSLLPSLPRTTTGQQRPLSLSARPLYVRGMGVPPRKVSERDTYATAIHGRDAHATTRNGRDAHTTTVHGRDAHAISAETNANLRPWERAATAVALAAMLTLFVLTPWGRSALGASAAMTVGWLGRAAEMASAIPILGSLAAFVVSLLSGVGAAANHFQQALLGVSPTVVFADFALFATVFYAVWLRRARQPWRL